MPLLPIEQMRNRLERDREESDVAYFMALLYFAEMVSKLTVAGMVAAIGDDSDRSRYAIAHELVRADGLGEWRKALDEVLVGRASQALQDAARPHQKELTQRRSRGDWGRESVHLLWSSADMLGIRMEKPPDQVPLRRWHAILATLRNKTRGHGAIRPSECSRVCGTIQESIDLLVDNFSLFDTPWAFLHQNLSGKYRVTSLSTLSPRFEELKRESGFALPDGVYIDFDHLSRVELVESDSDASDFLIANGNFNGERYECISYATNETRTTAADAYLLPVSELPPSETQSSTELDVVGNTFSNMPRPRRGYVSRDGLENELRDQLCMDRHPIVTLSGSGGIGKTTLALQVLDQISRLPNRPFENIVWFSARDIDLLESGPKSVRAHLIRRRDFANEYARLMNPSERSEKGFSAVNFLDSALASDELGATLFVFDNFETVENPAEVFRWIDTCVRFPNKVLITTRIRDFRGDYPVEVRGMRDDEARSLIASVAENLAIQKLMTETYTEDLIRESDGHPYVLKIMLGEVAKSGRLAKPERIVATDEGILTALFERTFSSLSAAAQRVFLLLCSWRSLVPEIALEAVLLRPQNERMNVPLAIEELQRSSFVELVESEADDGVFVSVPLAAFVFGGKKLAVNPLKSSVETDSRLLQAFGAARKDSARHGVLPRVRRLVQNVARSLARGEAELQEVQPILEFLASRAPDMWLELAELYGELDNEDRERMVQECLSRLLESPTDRTELSRVWKRLADSYRRSGDDRGELHALVEMCRVEDVPIYVMSSAANRVNSILLDIRLSGKEEVDRDERHTLLSSLAQSLLSREGELDANGCSRLAWLFVNLGDQHEGRRVAQRGLALEPDNQHCRSLVERLSG